MELVLGRNFLDRLVTSKGAKSHVGLKIRGKITSFSHLVFLLQRMEYTLSPCPIFQDHLTRSDDQNAADQLLLFDPFRASIVSGV